MRWLLRSFSQQPTAVAVANIIGTATATAATMAAMRPAATADLKAAHADLMVANKATARATAKAVVAAMAGRRAPVAPCPIAPPIGPQWALS